MSDTATFFVEGVKIAAAAIAGGLATLFVTKRQAQRKRVFEVDVTGSRDIGGFQEIGLQVLFEGEQFDFVRMSVVTVRNTGNEIIEDIEMVFWDAVSEHRDWFVRFLISDGAHRANASSETKEEYVHFNIDFLNPGQEEDFILVSKYDAPIKVASRTKSAKFVDLREKRRRAIKLGNTILRGFGIGIR